MTDAASSPHWNPLASDSDHDAGFRAWAMSEQDEPCGTWELARRDARRLCEQLQSAEAHGAQAEAFIAHMDMGYRWVEWLESHVSSPATRTCEKCKHDSHEPGACGANVGTGYQGAVLCRCDVSDPASEPEAS